MELLKEEKEKSNRLINSVSDETWEKLKELAKYNSVTMGRMVELLVEDFLD